MYLDLFITNTMGNFNLFEVGWKKRTPKSGKIRRRRCHIEKGSPRKIQQGVSRGSGETGNGREAIGAGGRTPAVIAAIYNR